MQFRNLTIRSEDLELKDHVCFLYNREEEHRVVVTDFVRYGLNKGEKVIYVRDAHSEDDILGYLEEADLDVESLLASGQLSITDFLMAYMYGSTFDPERMVRLVRNETQIALAEGWEGLRITTEMTWVLKRFPGSERVMEFESNSNKFYHQSRCLAMCQYDYRQIRPDLLVPALTTHPLVAFGTRIYVNPYYRLPSLCMKREPASAILGHWLGSLAGENEPSVYGF